MFIPDEMFEELKAWAEKEGYEYDQPPFDDLLKIIEEGLDLRMIKHIAAELLGEGE